MIECLIAGIISSIVVIAIIDANIYIEWPACQERARVDEVNRLAQQKAETPSDTVKQLLEILGHQQKWKYQTTRMDVRCLMGPWLAIINFYCQPTIYEDGKVNVLTSPTESTLLELTSVEQKLIADKAAPIFARDKAEIQERLRNGLSRYLNEVGKTVI